jgi:hypothetical protein
MGRSRQEPDATRKIKVNRDRAGSEEAIQCLDLHAGRRGAFRVHGTADDEACRLEKTIEERDKRPRITPEDGRQHAGISGSGHTRSR